MLINLKLLYILHSLTGITPTLDSLWYLLAVWLGWLFIFILFVLWVSPEYIHKHPLKNLIVKLKDFSFIAVASMGAFVVSAILKDLFHKARPFVTHENIQPLFNPGMYDSFPSGHAIFFLLFALLIYRHHKVTGMIGIGVAFIIGVSRIIVGVHYPIDILGGWGIAI